MRQFFTRSRNRWLIMALVFGIGPMIICLALISPPMFRISSFQNRVNLETAGAASIEFGPVPATNQELEQLEEVRQYELTRIKKIESRESLLHFSGALADALASEARLSGLRVKSVGLQNALIQGRYVPESSQALAILAGLPGSQWNELVDPVDLPMLNLPSIEIQMTVAAEYSQVFSFIESLPDFPVLVSLSSLSMIDDPMGKAFQLKIRGFYYASEKGEQLAQLENTVSP
jgi:hypothetical protein